MNLRTIETFLARLTLAALLVYFPVETWASLPHGLLSPFYAVDLIAMLLLFWGSVHSLRARPETAPGLLCAAFAWAASNGWRATFWRLEEIRAGGRLEHGIAEAWAVGVASALALTCFCLTLLLVVRRR